MQYIYTFYTESLRTWNGTVSKYYAAYNSKALLKQTVESHVFPKRLPTLEFEYTTLHTVTNFKRDINNYD